MKTTLLESYYDEEGGLSVCYLQKGNNRYLGIASLREEDADIASSYAGCRFAEEKARIQIAKEEYKEELKILNTLNQLYERLTQLKEFDDYYKSRPVAQIRKQIKIQEQKVEEKREKRDMLITNYPDLIEKRLSTAREIPSLLKMRQDQRDALAKEA